MSRPTKYVLNLLIVCYLAVIYFSGVPETNTLNTRLKDKAMKVAFALGIWPSWSMFAPNPIRFDSKSFVAITHKNGVIDEYDVEIKLDGILATFRKARWMKYSQDNLRSPTQRGLLASAIRHFTKRYADPQNPIVSVQIKRKWAEVHPFSHRSIPPIYRTPRIQKDEILITQKVENE
jgi:hypothetical protein